MKININKDYASIVEEESFNSGAVDFYEIETSFSSEWDNLTIKMVIVDGNNTALVVGLMDGKFIIPELEEGIYRLGFVGYNIENEIKTKQISTNLIPKMLYKGAGDNSITVEEEEVPTSTVWEQYVATMQAIMQDTVDVRADVNNTYAEYNLNSAAKTIEFNDNYATKKQIIDDVCTNVQEIEDNVEQMQTDINIAIEEGLQDYNDNASAKTSEFNDNYTVKKAEIDNVKDVATDLVSAVTFSTFDVDTDDGCIYIVTPEKLANAGFELNEETGELEISLGGINE